MRFDELGKGQIRQALAKRIYSKWEAIGHGLISSVFFFFFLNKYVVVQNLDVVRFKREGGGLSGCWLSPSEPVQIVGEWAGIIGNGEM